MIERLAPFIPDARNYTASLFRSDLIAGLTVAVFAIPQAMAYAMLAGVAPVYGLYTAIVMSIVAALWGSSPYINTGPTNSASLLTVAALLPFANSSDHMSYIVTLCLLVGTIRLVMGLVRMGSLLDFVPESAFLGFTIGAGLLIAMGQLHHLLGVTPPETAWFPARMMETFSKAGELNIYALLIGMGNLILMTVLSKRRKKFPTALVVISASALLVWLMDGLHGIKVVRDIAEISSGLPPFSIPLFDLDVMEKLFPTALAIAAIGLIESASIGQTLALRRGERLDINQEFIGQGLSQIAGSFLSSIPGSGSFARSLLIETSGGATRFANVIFGVATLAALCLVPALLEWIPIAALSGLLIFIGIKLVDTQRIRRVFNTSRSDSAMMIITFSVTVFYRIEYGIFAGIVGAALVHLYRSRELQLVEYIPTATGRIAELPYGPDYQHAPCDIVALGISGDLFYGISSALRNTLNNIAQEQQPKHLVVRIRRAYSIDYSCWSVLFDLAEQLKKKQRHLYLCGVRPDVQNILKQADTQDALPVHHIYPATDSPFQAFDSCIAAIIESGSFSDPRIECWKMRSQPNFHNSPDDFEP